MTDPAPPRVPTPPTPPPPRAATRLAIGSVLARTCSTWVRGLPSFTAMSLIVFAPLLVWALRFTSEERTETEIAPFYAWSWGAANLLATLLGAGVVYGVLTRLRGRPAGLWSCLSTALSRFLPALAVTLLTVVHAVLVYVCAMLPWTLVSRSVRSPAAGYAFLGFGYLLMFLVAATFYVAVPVTVVERLGARKSMERSALLTRGNRLRRLGLVVFWMALGYGAALTAGVLFPGSLRAAVFCWLGLAAVVLAPLGAIGSAVVYHDLRRGREGATVDDLLAVFE